MKLFYETNLCSFYHGDSTDMSFLPDNTIDAVVTDPPYGLEFMGKEWDRLWDKRANTEKAHLDGTGNIRNAPTYKAGANAQIWHEVWAKEALRVLKPGAHALVFGGSRVHHRLMVALEDAGFEIRDVLMYMYGTGFPKSMDISKAIDKELGAEREVVGHKGGRYAYVKQDFRGGKFHSGADTVKTNMFDAVTAPVTNESVYWEGYGTALKPAYEPIILCRKPISERNVALNVMKWGVGGLNIDWSRIPSDGARPRIEHRTYGREGVGEFQQGSVSVGQTTEGRWPANVILDEEAARLLDEQTGILTSGTYSPHHKRTAPRLGHGGVYGEDKGKTAPREWVGDSGGPSRFFYVAKASKAERGEYNNHPTVKPIKLMEYLVRLVTPINGKVLDPFAGSGTTLLAAQNLGFCSIGIEKENAYCEIVKKRLSESNEGTKQQKLF